MSKPRSASDARKRELFLTALEKESPQERAAFLDGACGNDAQLRAAVEALLRSHQEDSFLEHPAVTMDPERTAVTVPITEQPGDCIGRYKLLEKLGEGGFGVVYMAEQRVPVKRRVALKIIKVGMDTREVVARFEAERQALALMDHPNIAKIYDAGSTERPLTPSLSPSDGQDTADDPHPQPLSHPMGEGGRRPGEGLPAGRPYFVMELVRGIKLTEYCDERNVPTRERLELFMHVCQAVQHAHQKGIIHRDLKPSNILVTVNDGQPVPKIIDFGIAKATQMELTEKTVFTRFQQFIGTPAYMSPEQADISSVDVDTRSDIYSLGVLLYELLTGRTPFDARELLKAGLDEMRRTIREKEPERPSTRVSTLRGDELTTTAKRRGLDAPKLIHVLRGDLDWIVMKCLEKDRARRYGTASGLAADIQRHLSNEPVVARPPSSAYRLQKLVRRNKLAFAATGAVAAALLLGLVLSVWQAVRATRAEKKTSETMRQVAAERDAKEQARKDAEAISKFLTEVFQSPDPTRDGREIKVAELLDKAAKQLETDLSTQPARRVKVQETLGKTYGALGLAWQAIPIDEKVRDYYLATFGPEHPATLSAMNSLAISFYDAGRRDEALKLREEVLTLRHKASGPDHVDTLEAMHNLGNSYFDAGRRPEALKLREDVLTLRRKVLGPEHPDTLTAMSNVGNSYYDGGRRAEALKLREVVLTLRRKVLGPEHPDTLRAMNNLGVSYAAAGRWAEAVELQEDVLTLRRKVNGPEHPNTLKAMSSLANYFADTGRRGEALQMREEVLKLCHKVIGPEHPETLMAMNNLANSYDDAGRREEELKLREEVLPLRRKVSGLEHPDTLMAMNNLAASYAEAGHLLEALELHEEALRLYGKVLGPEHHDTLKAMRVMASAYMTGRNYAQAEPLLSDLLARARTSASTNLSELESRLQDMADLRFRQKRYAEAEALYRERIESRMGRAGGETSDAVLATRASLGRLYSDWAWAERATAGAALYKRALEGEKLLRENIAAREGKLSTWRKAELQSRLGGALSVVALTDPGLTAATREPKLVEAEAVLQESQAGMEQDKNIEARHQRDGIERFIRLYEAWPKPDKLAEWKQKLADFDADTPNHKRAGHDP